MLIWGRPRSCLAEALSHGYRFSRRTVRVLARPATG